MATPCYYKPIPIALLLVVFATIAPNNLQQSAGVVVRAEGAAAASSPPIQLERGLFSHNFPCLPFLPKIIRDLCHDLLDPPPPPPPFPGCRSVLNERVVPSCTGFLTNSSVPDKRPPKACCNAIEHINLNATSARFCLCHVFNGDVGALLPAPLNQSRVVPVLEKCTGRREDSFTYMCVDHADFFHVPPMDPDAPPPAPETKRTKA